MQESSKTGRTKISWPREAWEGTMRIFINYRRDDSAGYAGRLYDRLAEHFGPENLFIDIDTIEPGQDFVEVIEKAVASYDVLIALIGRQWTSLMDETGMRRLDDPHDFVRLELETALEAGIRVIPVMVGSARIPRADELPESLDKLRRLNALEVSDTRFHHDVDRLIAALETVAESLSRETEVPPTPPVAPTVVQGADRAQKPTRLQGQAPQMGGFLQSVGDRIGALPTWAWAAAGALVVGLVVVVVGGGFALRIINDRLSATEPAVVVIQTEPPPEITSPPPAATTQAPETPLPIDEPVRVFIPAGEFEMGLEGGDPNVQPAHRVYLDAFTLHESEVTNAMYRLCVEAGDCMPPVPSEPPDLFNDPALDDHPVVWITRQDAERYCQWAGGRLPTEAEWEKAARGIDGRTYPWGESQALDSLLNFADSNLDADWADLTVDDGHEYTAPVGSYPDGRSAFGAFDMAGNVWEWVADWYDPNYYRESAPENPAGPASSPAGTRVVRGGSFLSNRRNITAVYRFGYAPETAAADLGFRCAFDPAP